jgi:phytoene desaturase
VNASRKVVVIGAGFSGLAAACFLAKAGHKVTILEKNEMTGGRARTFSSNGFVYDMGPSWYWMPDIFERFFGSFGKKVSDYYHLTRLSPSYKVVFPGNESHNIPSDLGALCALFESIESGSGEKLRLFLKDAAYKYQKGIGDLVYMPGHSVWEFAKLSLLPDVLKLNLLSSFKKHAERYFKDPRLLQLVEFPILFLGATASDTPALYSLMNYADMQLGTWYPMGGMYKIVEGMTSLAKELGVHIQTHSEVNGFVFEGKKISKVLSVNGEHSCDAVVASADYQHVESVLLKERSNYSEAYWSSRKLAPSSLLFYLGINKKIKGLLHHNLFFDADFPAHAAQIYSRPQWPDHPLFYACVPSITDSTVAPVGHENLFLLIPIAPGLKDDAQLHEKYLQSLLERMEKQTGDTIREHVVYSRTYSVSNFIQDYHSFKGNAYGLANTLLQTAFLKPALRSKKVSNLVFAGQLTVPGPGVPPSLISGELAAREVSLMLS